MGVITGPFVDIEATIKTRISVQTNNYTVEPTSYSTDGASAALPALVIICQRCQAARVGEPITLRHSLSEIMNVIAQHEATEHRAIDYDY